MPDTTTTPHDSNHHHQSQRPSSSSSAPSSMAVDNDGLEEDQRLSRSEFLTRQEVIKRRVHHLRQLSKSYREYYWELMEDLKVKHREYYWEYGKSPFQEDGESDNREGNFQGNEENGHGSSNGSANKCVVHGCKSKAMALTKFCHMHILSDAKQKLYKPCNYAIKSSQTGPILCRKPILRSTKPPYCALHFQMAEKHFARALKNAGLTVSSTSKVAPKFHVLVAECVRHIQSKRRSAQRTAKKDTALNV